jgi:hypothetical protein
MSSNSTTARRDTVPTFAPTTSDIEQLHRHTSITTRMPLLPSQIVWMAHTNIAWKIFPPLNHPFGRSKQSRQLFMHHGMHHTTTFGHHGRWNASGAPLRRARGTEVMHALSRLKWAPSRE